MAHGPVCLCLLHVSPNRDGNSLILVSVGSEQPLRIPMYFFLGRLSFLEICCATTIVPKTLESFLVTSTTVCVSCCLAQSFFHFFLGMTEFLILSAMSFNPYFAVCNWHCKKCYHDEESLFPSSAGSVGSGLCCRHLPPGGSAACGILFAPRRFLAIFTVMLSQHGHGLCWDKCATSKAIAQPGSEVLGLLSRWVLVGDAPMRALRLGWCLHVPLRPQDRTGACALGLPVGQRESGGPWESQAG